MHYIRISRVGKTACAVVLSCLLAAGPLMDSAPFYAFADEGTADVPATESDPARETAPEEKPQKHEQVNEDKPLAPDATQNQAPADKKPVEEGAANALPEGGAETSADGTAADVPSSPTVVNPDRVGVDVPLAQGEEVVATAGTVIVDGLSYVVNSDGGTATVAGCVDASAPKGDVIVAATVFSGSDEYLVTAVADEAFKDCEGIESIVLPDTLEAFGKDVFKGCSSLQRIEVGERSKLHAVHDGMLFNKELSTLLVCPEGKQPVASLPDSMTSFADDAFAGCRNLEAFQVEEGNQTFASVDGVLYSADRTRLVMAPARIVSVIVAPETNVIVAGAFSACSGLASIIANGYVETIEGKAFSLETLSKAMVALASGDDYDARKAVWDEAGFTNYIEPAVPGEIQQPAPTQSGFVYELLDDYTLAVSWTGENDPEADLVIPTTAKLDGVEYRVSAIAPAGFQGRQSLTSVQIRAPISAIGDDAFAGCTGLASVELSEGVSAIGAGAFSGTAVQRAVIPASVTSVGSRAFADCPDLSRIVTFSNAPSVAADAIAGCTGVAIYAPYNEAGEYSWNPGLVASGNHILPYGISLASDPLTLEVDETADLFEGGVCEVPEGCELTYSYAATPISVEAGQVTGKKLGTSEVTVALSLDGVELGRSVRVVEVVASSVVPRARPTEASVSDFDVMPVIGMADGVSGTCFWALDGAGKLVISPNDHISGVLANLPSSSSASPWSDYSGSVRNVEIRSRVKSASSLNFLFFRCSNMTSIAGLENLDTSSATNMSTMFNGCSSLLSLDVSGFETANTQNMSNMFNGCSRLTSLDLSSWNTANATNMNNMFSGCANLATISIGENFSKVLTGMLNNVGADLYVYGAPSVIQSSSAYTGTVHLMTADASGAKSKWTSAGYTVVDEYADAFAKGESGACSWTIDAAGKLSIYPSDGVSGTLEEMTDYSNVPWYESRLSIASVSIAPGVKSGKSLRWMFGDCTNMISVDGLGNLDVSDATDIGYMFNRCLKLESLDLSSWKTDNVTNMNYLFNECTALTSLNLKGWNTSCVNSMAFAFYDCFKLESLEVSHFNTANVTSMRAVFGKCQNLTTLDVSDFNTSKAEDLAFVFSGCSSLVAVDVSKWDTSSATTMDSMFKDCAGLTSLDVSGFKMSHVTTMESMFQGCRKVEKLDVSKWDTSSAKSMNLVFNACNSVVSLDLSGWNTSSVGRMKYMFYNCNSLATLDLSGWDTSAVTDMQDMFYSCSGLSCISLGDKFSFTGNGSTSCSLPAPYKENDSYTGKWQAVGSGTREYPAGTVYEAPSDIPSNTKAEYSRERAKYAVSFDANGGTGDSTKSVSHGFSVEAPANPERNGYAFNGWYTAKSGGSLYDFSTPVTGSLTLYAAWTPISYAITYKLNGGVVSGNPESYTIETETFTLANPLKTDYAFAGWSGTDLNDNIMTVVIPKGSTGDRSYVANWTLNTFTVSFDSKGGSSVESLEVQHGMSVQEPDAPTKEGYVFEGWYKNEACTEAWNFQTDIVIGDTTLYAKWSEGNAFGDGCAWKIDAQGCLSIYPVNGSGGTLGEMASISDVPWYSQRESITSASIAPDVKAGANLSGAFQGCSKLVVIDGLGNLETSGVTNMSNMFNGCSSLASLDVSNWNVSSVVNMNNMFRSCSSLASLDVSRWNTTAVENTDSMFLGCSNLASLAVADWNMSKVSAIAGMFSGCSKLAELDVSTWDTSSAKNMVNLFHSCKSLTTLDVSGWKTSAVTNMTNTFYGCSGLLRLDLSKWDTSSVTSMAGMFANCSALESLNVSGFKTENVDSMNAMFKGCSGITTLDVTSFDTSKVTDMFTMFNGCSNLTSLDVSGFATSAVKNMNGLFYNCSSLTSLAVSNWDTSAAENMGSLFSCCSSLKSLDLSKWKTERVTSLGSMFYNCTSLTLLNVSGWNTSNVQNMGSTFNNCSALTSLDLSGWSTAKVAGMGSMLRGCASLTSFVIPDGFIGSGISEVSQMFVDCPELTAIPSNLAFPENLDITGLFGFTEFPESFIDTTYEGTDERLLNYDWLSDGRVLNSAVRTEGKLPTTDGGENASWTLSPDGTLAIRCDVPGAVIDDLKWSYDTTIEGYISSNVKYWGPLRQQIKSAVMDPSIQAVSMEQWFAWMPQLSDASKTYIPEGCTSIRALFGGTAITALPDGFTIPQGVQNAQDAFASCGSLAALPAGFIIPDTVTNAQGMFVRCASLTNLPEGFTIPGSVKNARAMFEYSGLTSLPKGFTLERGVGDAAWMFHYCRSLSALPEGFSLPNTLTDVTNMFQDDPTLTSLPSTLDLSALSTQAQGTTGAMFKVDDSNKANPIPTLYAGDDVNKVLGQEYWTSQNRKIYVANDPNNPLPDTVHLVTFKIPDESSPDGWKVYQSSLTNEASGLIADPGDPQAFGYPFKGWYANEACTAKFDFSKQITADDVVVYGAFGAPILRGTVPLEANVVVDNAGGSTTASAEIRSFTPVDIYLTSVSCETGPGIAELFPNEADRTKPFATVKFPDQAEPVKASFTGQPAATSVTIPLSTGWTSPGRKDCDISLDLNGAQVRHRIEDYAAQIANIVWTVEVKK